ncbi:mechanosensitive ion channel family protein [Ramlibacter albus]|uniref:Mechanosensitive ion channel n=1 Tax=Ramlibacter albus TaxID=2079448 RepID=A0A923S3C9_9BURK|nr:mechanosensitive ion channel domain-containing protein [Ramlibacter albus]MBC5766310.1 mechanosensitive ion channel [Ramlibacter albus]
MTELDRLARDLGHPGMPWEIAALLACLGIAFGAAWLLGRKRSDDSVWFGRGIVDGLLFPLLALALVYVAKVAMQTVQPVALLRIALPILVSLAGIRFLARVSTVAFPHSGVARVVERLFSWLAWLAAVLWIVGLLPVVTNELDDIHFMFGKAKVSLLAIVQGVLSCGVVLVLTLWISKAIEKRVLQDAVDDLSLRKVVASAIRAGLLLVGVLLALSAVGVDLTALSVLGGALGVGLGFGLQKLAANYVSGFVILFERSVRIGDTVRVDNFEGVVADIKTRYTLIRSLTGRESIVPNEKLITERIENLSLADPRVLVTTDLTVGNDADHAQIEQLLLAAARSTPRVIADPAPAVRLARFGTDGLEYQLQFWIQDPQNGQGNVKSDVNVAILKGLREAGIELPTPQRVVRVLS